MRDRLQVGRVPTEGRRDIYTAQVSPSFRSPKVYARTYDPQSVLETNPVDRKNQKLGDILDQAGEFEGVRSHVLSKDTEECQSLECKWS
jgi:hypothetical protein